jgi:hypothetical protein
MFWNRSLSSGAMPKARRTSALALALLYLSGLLALIFHLATEDHSPFPNQGAAAWLTRPPCHHGSAPHSAGDHDANTKTDEPRAPSFEALHPITLLAVLPPPAGGAPDLSPDVESFGRVPVVWRLIPPKTGDGRRPEQPRAPPAA